MQIAGVDSRDSLQCQIVWPRDVFNLPVDEYAGYCVMLVVFLQNALELSAIWHFIKLLYLNRYCILLQHSQGLHSEPYHSVTLSRNDGQLRYCCAYLTVTCRWFIRPEPLVAQ